MGSWGGLISGGRISVGDLYPGESIIGCILFVGRRAYNWVASKWEGGGAYKRQLIRCGSHFT